MNLPNKLTILRVVMVPFFLAFFLIDRSGFQLIALGIFILASATDWLDGYLARKNNQVTTFGKFMDPLADKMLTTAAFLGFLYYGYMNPWALMIILAREFMVSGVRMAAADKGHVIAASMWGKFKTVAQMVTIIISVILIALPLLPEGMTHMVIALLIWVSTVLTLISGVDYLLKNRECLEIR